MNVETINLKTGIAIVPEDFIVVEETKTDESDYIGIISERQSCIPHYVVYLDKPIEDIDLLEEDEIYKKCAAIYPDIAKVMQSEVGVILDDNGNIVNFQEWIESGRLGLFGVPEVDNKDDMYNDIGIIRRFN